MNLNTQVRLSARKVAVLYQLFSHRINGRVTAARLISEAVLEIYNSARKSTSRDLRIFETDQDAAYFLATKGFITSQFDVEAMRTPSKKSPVIDLSTALDQIISERDGKGEENEDNDAT